MKRSYKLTNRMLAVVTLWTSVAASGGYFMVQHANAGTSAENVFARAGVTATANGYVSDAFAPSLAIDGHRESGEWQFQGNDGLPTAENPYWLEVDAGSEVSVEKFVVGHAGAGGEEGQYNTKDFTIQTSDDNVNWTPVVTVDGNTEGTTTHDLDTPVTARYFKLSITNPGEVDSETGFYAARIYEFEAIGFDKNEEAPEAPDNSNQEDTSDLAAEPGEAHGLLGEYYLNTGSGNNFAYGDYKATTVDSLINFTDLNPVLKGMTGVEENANVRWTGQIMPPASGDYTFYMMGDNGFRVWIDNKLVIDHWVNDWDKEQTSTPVTLEGNRKYDIKIEYFEDFGGANLYLRWSTPALTKEIIPENAFYLPADYTGAKAASVAADGKTLLLDMISDLKELPAELNTHLAVTVDGQAVPVQSIAQGAKPNGLTMDLSSVILPGQSVKLSYDGQGGLQYKDGSAVKSFVFSPTNFSEVVDYTPYAIAMTLYKNAKINRAFAWYTTYNKPQSAPTNATDSIVELVPAGENFDSSNKLRVVGKPEETRVLNNLKITSSTTGTFISHKVLVEGLKPGTAYKYRVGNDGYWSEAGSFTTEAENEDDFSFLYMTDSQGSNSQDYDVWGNTMQQAITKFPDARFLLMTGDQVDAGALESQWLDYFKKPQSILMNLPIMAAVGNHEGPYNDNYYYHFNYPNDSIEDPLPPGSVYAYDYGDAHIMVLNTMDMGWDQRQKDSFKQEIEWLKHEVATTDKKWKIVGFHKAIYSVGNHALDGDILDLRKMLYPVFDELGIDVVLQGHDHTFMRSYQMLDNKPVQNVKTDAQGRAVNPDGTLYMINNSAATKFYDVKDGVDRFYAAVYQQPKKAIFSGVSMTEDSFKIDSFMSGETSPFDTYTIVRDEEKPKPVEQLDVVKSVNGNRTITWNKPEDEGVRGFRIYEKNDKLGANWSVYIPAVAGQASYQYVVEKTNLDQAYEFVVKAVNKRDNSEGKIATSAGDQPAAPTAPVVDDAHNTFGWTNAADYAQVSDYEYSMDNGTTWKPATANPQPIVDGSFAAGAVQVRVKANEAKGIIAGKTLVSTKAFTKNDTRDTFLLTGEIERDKQMKVSINVEPLVEYEDDAYVVFQLMKGNNPQPLLVSAVPLKKTKLEMTQYFNETGADYKVKVFVVNQFDSKNETPVQLARPKLFQ
ncbi:PA14 domain-containing protein [Paenibacillus glycanilyticus]|uniref:PA14 domain-containing protein n=1 Tax=Paenibacillus glycanilyticus TaxID=126569 RepID=UPI002041DC55|nr:PA14 domain-containing protein [Paenibacillus glycanilyticus]MCM3631518.1 PA14 domain-containing protein [Paenibacillus glycanilyticus]